MKSRMMRAGFYLLLCVLEAIFLRWIFRWIYLRLAFAFMGGVFMALMISESKSEPYKER